MRLTKVCIDASSRIMNVKKEAIAAPERKPKRLSNQPRGRPLRAVDKTTPNNLKREKMTMHKITYDIREIQTGGISIFVDKKDERVPTKRRERGNVRT